MSIVIDEEPCLIMRIFDRPEKFQRSRTGRFVAAVLLLIASLSSAAEKSSFYYDEPKKLEQRMNDFLRGEYDGLLIHYPCAMDAKTRELELRLIDGYGRDEKAESIKSHVEDSLRIKARYPIWMISVAVYREDQAIAFLEAAREGINKEKSPDLFLGACVMNVMKRRFLVDEDDRVNRRYLTALESFFKVFRESSRENPERFKLLEDVEVDLLLRLSSILKDNE